MNPDMMLAQLAPLRTPESIGWWPMAPGWWIVLALTIFGLVLIGRWIRQRYVRTHYRRAALSQLRLLKGTKATTTDINQLLKAAALRAFPAEQVAALHGQAWQDFLLTTCENLPTEGLAELDSLYAAHPPAATEALLLMTEYWVRRHEVSNA